jgi:Zn finger protein HypA/HybF involved in hydrogenase expression
VSPAVEFPCPDCGYNLSGVSYRYACPGCGKPVVEALGVPPPPPEEIAPSAVDEHGRVAVDALCLTCGYNIRGLEATGRCPECGVAIANSVRGSYLRFAGVEVLGRMASGAMLIEWSLVVRACGWLLGMALGWAGGGFAALVVVAAAMVVAPGLNALGWSRLAAPQPLLERVRSRRTALVLVLVGSSLEALIMIGSTVGARTVGAYLSPLFYIPLLLLFWCVSMAYRMHFMVHAAELLPSKVLAKWSRVGRWVFPVFGVLAPVLIFGCVPILMVGAVAFAFYFVLVDRWRDELRRYQRLAAAVPALP